MFTHTVKVNCSYPCSVISFCFAIRKNTNRPSRNGVCIPLKSDCSISGAICIAQKAAWWLICCIHSGLKYICTYRSYQFEILQNFGLLVISIQKDNLTETELSKFVVVTFPCVRVYSMDFKIWWSSFKCPHFGWFKLPIKWDNSKN